jgi:predicted RNA binding protein YcfA (HicA-like mRNA interferase family)
MDLSPKRLVQILEENGFSLKRMGKGSYHIYYNPETKVTVPVPIHGKDVKKGTFIGILKDAGIDTRKLFE